MIDIEIPEPIRPGRQPGDAGTVNAAAAMLRDTRRPFIVAGAGVVLSDAVDEYRRLAECLGAPVANSYLHRKMGR